MSSNIDYQPLKSQSVVESVKEWITSQIINGALKPGDKLPTENELYQNLGASRNSIREAIKQLEAYGVLYIKRAEGTFISDSFNEKMLSPLLYSLLLQNNKWEDFVEFRRAIDIGCLYVLTSKDITEKQAKDLKSSLEELELVLSKSPTDKVAITDADCRFHSELIRLTENPQLMTISSYVNRITAPSREATTQKAIDLGKIDNFASLHHQIYDVVINKSKEIIEDVVSNHYIYWKKRV